MDYALRLGRRALGLTAENPNVGCVIVKDGRVLGVGWTQPGGRPHAETMALAMASNVPHSPSGRGQGEGPSNLRGAAAYVTLEPCAHHGRTPPCAEALLYAGIARVVAAIEDPDPRVAGRGFAVLRAAGVAVEIGQGADEARRDLAGFLTRITKKRPYVLLKLAISADNKIAAGPGRQTAITGDAVRARVHLTRAQSDAILVGMGTVRSDDPDLSCRLPGLENRSPKPFVLGHEPLPPTSKLAARGASVLCGEPAAVLAGLAAQGINRVMVEGGARIARAFVDAGLVDELQLYRAPLTIGHAGLDAFAGLHLAQVLEPFALDSEESLGPDRLGIYIRRS